MKVVLDTNIIVSALMSSDNACRDVLRMAFDGRIAPIISNALFCEYEDVLGRDYIFKKGPFDTDKRIMFLNDFLSVCHWVDIRYLWRPNLRDEGDNHVVELAIAGQGHHIVTQNIKDFRKSEIATPQIEITHPYGFLEGWRTKQWQH